MNYVENLQQVELVRVPVLPWNGCDFQPRKHFEPFIVDWELDLNQNRSKFCKLSDET